MTHLARGFGDPGGCGAGALPGDFRQVRLGARQRHPGRGDAPASVQGAGGEAGCASACSSCRTSLADRFCEPKRRDNVEGGRPFEVLRDVRHVRKLQWASAPAVVTKLWTLRFQSVGTAWSLSRSEEPTTMTELFELECFDSKSVEVNLCCSVEAQKEQTRQRLEGRWVACDCLRLTGPKSNWRGFISVAQRFFVFFFLFFLSFSFCLSQLHQLLCRAPAAQVLYVAGGATQNSIRVAQWMLQAGFSVGDIASL